MSFEAVSGRTAGWDLDFRLGEWGEIKTYTVIDAIAQSKVEVKTDLRVRETGNLYIEYEKEKPSGEFVPSGIAITQSEYWAFAFGVGVIFIDIHSLRTLFDHYLEKGRVGSVSPSPGNACGSKGVLIPLEVVIDVLKKSQEGVEQEVKEIAEKIKEDNQ